MERYFRLIYWITVIVCAVGGVSFLYAGMSRKNYSKLSDRTLMVLVGVMLAVCAAAVFILCVCANTRA